MELSEIGISEKKAKQLNKNNIFSVEDFFKEDHVPRKYYDLTKCTGILPPDQITCTTAIVKIVKLGRGNKSYILAVCELTIGGTVKVFWFNQDWNYYNIRALLYKTVYIAGRFTTDDNYDGYTCANPEFFVLDSDNAHIVKPVYKKIQGMSESYYREKLEKAFMQCTEFEDPLPSTIVESTDLLPMRDALKKLHFPKSMDDVAEGRNRLLFNDLVKLGLIQEYNERNLPLGNPFRIKNTTLLNKFIKTLPFELTEGQKRVIDNIVAKAKDGRYINYMIVGETGSGKTVVAEAAMIAYVSQGYQTVLLCPTKLLAKQHYKSFCEAYKPIGMDSKVVYLGSDLKAAEKKAILKRIETGDAQVVIGTSSVIGKDVKYHSLALAICDEEHRYGISTKKNLTEKGKDGCGQITLSATPIPKSLSDSLYGGSVQLEEIKSVPKGRLPIITGIAVSRERIYKFIRTQVSKGRQVYIVCPNIEESEGCEKASVNQISKEYKEALGEEFTIETLTGKDSKERTEAVMSAFYKGDVNILIATTIIEVGISCENASVMIIEDAQCFGLAQLHQLRGRVGRKAGLQGYCVLEVPEESEDTERLKYLCECNDGFELAKKDLELRGPGSLIGGTNQSGRNKLILLAAKYPEIYKQARKFAKDTFDFEGKYPLRDEIMREGYEL